MPAYIELSLAYAEALAQLEKLTGKTQSTLVNQALTSFLEQQKEFIELCADVAQAEADIAAGKVYTSVEVMANAMSVIAQTKQNSIDTRISHITPVGGNIFLDLGFPPDEVVRLKADSDRWIRAKLALAQGSDDKTKFYPAQFTPAEEGGFVVIFRDIPEAVTQGDDFDEAEKMAKDVLLSAIELYREENRPIPQPSEPQDGEFLTEIRENDC